MALLVTERYLRRLTKIALNMDHNEIPSIMIKIVSRILTSPSMTLRAVSDLAFLDVFSVLLEGRRVNQTF